MGRFHLNDNFVRKYAKQISIYDQVVFMALTCHANASGDTFIGCRRIAECMGISKNTVSKSIKNLEAYHLVRRLKNSNGKVSQLRVYPVPYEAVKPYQCVGHKEYIKEYIKEEDKCLNKNKEEALNKLRAYLQEKGIIYPNP